MDGMNCSGQIVDALMSGGRERKCRELSVRASWFSAGNRVGKLVSLVPACEVCAHQCSSNLVAALSSSICRRPCRLQSPEAVGLRAEVGNFLRSESVDSS